MKSQEIVDLIRDRDQKGISVLYDNYAGSLNGIVFRIVQSKEISEEVLQNTFMKIWNSIDLFDSSKGTLYTWMARIARNAALDQVRLKSFSNSKKTDPIDEHVNTSESKIDLAGMDSKKLLSGLDKKLLEVIDLIYLQGYSQSQAAEELDIPLGTVKTRVRNALLQLREVLKDEKVFFMGIFIALITLIFLLWN